MQRATSAIGLFFFLALSLAACKPTAPSAPDRSVDTGVPSTATSDVLSQAANCPDADFASFLKRFEASADVQRASTAKVVTMDSVDADAQPSPKEVTKQVPRADMRFPILFGPAERKAQGLEETVTERGPIEREVKHAVPDSGVQVRFNFQASPCWTLVRVSDDAV